MPAPDYTSLPQSIARAQERSGVADTSLIEEVLRNTAGKRPEDDTPVYRPYWAAAELLDQRRRDITAAEGAQFRNVKFNIDALRRMQWTIDHQMQLIVPFGTRRNDTRTGLAARKTVSGAVRVVQHVE